MEYNEQLEHIIRQIVKEEIEHYLNGYPHQDNFRGLIYKEVEDQINSYPDKIRLREIKELNRRKDHRGRYGSIA